MPIIENFGETDRATVTVLVDNRADLLAESTDTVKYFTKGGLLAEHGLSMLIDLPAAGRRILWDAGLSQIALLENMQRMEIDPTTIDLIALSHGHSDHTAGMTEVLQRMNLGIPKSRVAAGRHAGRIGRRRAGPPRAAGCSPGRLSRALVGQKGRQHGRALFPAASRRMGSGRGRGGPLGRSVSTGARLLDHRRGASHQL